MSINIWVASNPKYIDRLDSKGTRFTLFPWTIHNNSKPDH